MSALGMVNEMGNSCAQMDDPPINSSKGENGKNLLRKRQEVRGVFLWW
jgi:hypothetical protein